MSKERGPFEEQLKKAFEAHEVPVRPGLWSGIQAQVAANAASGTAGTAAAGMGVLGKASAIIGAAALLTLATVSEVNYQRQQNAAVPAQTIEHKEADGGKKQESAAMDNGSVEADAASLDRHQELGEAHSEQAGPQTTTPVASEAIDTASQRNEPKTTTPAEDEQMHSPIAADQGAAPKNAASGEHADQSHGGATSKTTEQAARENRSGHPAGDRQQGNPPSGKDRLNAEQVQPLPASEEASENEDRGVIVMEHRKEGPITPDGDGKNDYFSVRAENVKAFSIIIMDRSGRRVFESTDPGFQWKGRDMRGEPLPTGVYYFVIQATGTDGKPYVSKGSQTLFR